jgi:hypothetical protein
MANQFNKTLNTGIGTTPIEVYSTASNTKATVIGINLANTTDGTVFADIQLRDETSATGFIVKNAEIPPGSALAAMGGDQKLVMDPLNYLLITSDTPNSIDAIVSVLEITS